jgi:hypothetical protein
MGFDIENLKTLWDYYEKFKQNIEEKFKDFAHEDLKESKE